MTASDAVAVFDDTAGQYRVAWTRQSLTFGTDSEIVGITIDASGAVQGSRQVLVPGTGGSGPYTQPLLFDVGRNSSNGEYLLAFGGHEPSNGTFAIAVDLWVLRLDAAFRPIGPPVMLAAAPDGSSWSDLDAELAYNAARNEYLVVWAGEVTGQEVVIRARPVGADGAPRGDAATLSDSFGPLRWALHPTAVFNPDGQDYLVAWQANPDLSQYEVHAQRVEGDGTRSGTNVVLSSATAPDAARDAFWPAVVYNAVKDEFLVVWAADAASLGLDDDAFGLVGQRLSVVGAPVGTNFAMSGGAPGPRGGAASSELALRVDADANHYYAAWRATLSNGEVEWLGRVLSATGNPIGDVARLTHAGTDGDVSAIPGDASLVSGRGTGAYLLIWGEAGGLSGRRLEAGPASRFACPAAPTSPFTDIASSFAATSISCLSTLGLVSGTTATTYSPLAGVTRDQMAVFLMGAFETATGGPYSGVAESDFVDIAGNFAANRIEQLVGLGVTSGVSAVHYAPADPVTREQMAVFLIRLYEEITDTVPPLVADPFIDTTASFANDRILQLVGLGVTAGTSADRYSPSQVVTREQMATFLVRLLEVATA